MSRLPVPLCRDPLPGAPLKLIVANEFAERFCFYGTRSLLVIFLTSRVHISDANAASIYSLYIALSYFSPLLGGYVADVWLGRFYTILCFNVAYLIGVATWAATSTSDSLAGCLCGLSLMALGAGGIKPNISPLGADQLVGASETQLVEYFFWQVTVEAPQRLLTLTRPLLPKQVLLCHQLGGRDRVRRRPARARRLRLRGGHLPRPRDARAERRPPRRRPPVLPHGPAHGHEHVRGRRPRRGRRGAVRVLRLSV